MLQLRMIERAREACQEDERIESALMFGSFAIGEGDAFSDIEFAVFISDEAFDGFDQRAWLEAVGPVAAYFMDAFGHNTALFENGVRGEFHFLRATEVPIVESWQGHGWFPSLDAAVVLDRSGELSRHARALVGGPPARGGTPLVERLALNLINLMLLGVGLLNRGEFARAWALLSKAHEPLLKLVRLHEGATDHWPTPSRALETDLSDAAYERYVTEYTVHGLSRVVDVEPRVVRNRCRAPEHRAPGDGDRAGRGIARPRAGNLLRNVEPGKLYRVSAYPESE